MSKPLIAAVLISGNGSNLQAIIDTISERSINCEIRLVLSNRSDAYGLTRASQAGITTRVINHRDFADRLSFDRAMMEVLDPLQPDVLILAGFMRILSSEFVQHYHGRMINIHPALLPDLKGLDTHQRALDGNHGRHGATVHYVTPDLDSGPAIVQGSLDIREDDDAKSLQQRVHRIEHRIYPLVVEWLAEGRLTYDESIFLDGNRLDERGIQYHYADV